MLTLDQLKSHLRLPAADTAEDTPLTELLADVTAMFRKESKRRWPAEGEPREEIITDATTDPPTTVPGAYLDPAVLDDDEQRAADRWILLMCGHLYENRQLVAVGVSVTEVPLTCERLMSLLREPTI